jgi:hypothetical protein
MLWSKECTQQRNMSIAWQCACCGPRSAHNRRDMSIAWQCACCGPRSAHNRRDMSIAWQCACCGPRSAHNRAKHVNGQCAYMCDCEPINLYVHCVGVGDLTSRTSGRPYNSEVLSHSSVSYQQQHAWPVSTDVWLCHLCAAVVRMNNSNFGLWYAHEVCAVQHLRCHSAHEVCAVQPCGVIQHTI